MKRLAPATVPTAIATSGTIEVLSRIGYIAHGAIYMFIGVLAARLAWGLRGDLADPPSAIGLLQRLPNGPFVVSFFALGLVAYALWRFVQAVADPDCQGRTPKGLFVRAGRVISGLGYSALALFAARLASGSLQDPEGQPNWAYRLLTEPVGAVLGGLVGLILFVVASDDIRKACTMNFGERLNDREMGPALTTTSRAAGRWGFAARAVILLLGGTYLLRAVFKAEPHLAKGFEGILLALLLLPFGDWALLTVGLGLAAYGLFMVQVGLYRRHPF